MKYFAAVLLVSSFVNGFIKGFSFVDVGMVAVMATFIFLSSYYTQSKELKAFEDKVKAEFDSIKNEAAITRTILEETKLGLTSMNLNMKLGLTKRSL